MKSLNKKKISFWHGKDRYELADATENQPNWTFLHQDSTIKITMGCRTLETCKFKRKQGFRLHAVINTK